MRLADLLNGRELTVVVMAPPPCSHPDNTPLTGYWKGCRCQRCVTGKRDYDAGYWERWKKVRGLS